MFSAKTTLVHITDVSSPFGQISGFLGRASIAHAHSPTSTALHITRKTSILDLSTSRSRQLHEIFSCTSPRRPVALSPCRPVALSPCRPVALSPCRPPATTSQFDCARACLHPPQATSATRSRPRSSISERRAYSLHLLNRFSVN
jgi:hypothetical protein